MAKIKMLFLNESICSQRPRDFFSISLLLMMGVDHVIVFIRERCSTHEC